MKLENGIASKLVSSKEYASGLSRLIADSIATNGEGCEVEFDSALEDAVTLLQEIKVKGNKVLLIGNGGSAALVAHMQNDLCKCNHIRSMVFTEASLLTALTNDEGYDIAYAYQIGLWAEEGDLLLAVSSSGQSENIIQAARVARQRGMKILGFSGFGTENALRQMGDINIYIPSTSYGMVEIGHSLLCHYLTDRIAECNNEQ